ncbi:CRISPR-associated endonuclease Cas1 [Streptomyces sp. B1866]|uniref:CRISPR-associated endonuclease Cas1 n=1 Tax=Streptomyces sp. B1866 TaxID=3075431 RepID=UPI0028913DE1|nr:CRISPR-associated endonuclease Cas1 [Streptomyces sp. B1866]MDT3397743.1 CRISPR-associated endonuclease Cas1 [Streptomyces sp. B1866]
MRRIIVTALDGYVTLDALRWCAEVGIAVIVLDTAGGELMTNGAGHNDARLRRAQAAAPVAVARAIVAEKLRGQYERCGHYGVKDALLRVQDAVSVEEIRGIEAQAARYYWAHYRRTSVDFRGDVPDHWRTMGPRNSALTGTNSGGYGFEAPRRAVTPINAALNLAYTIGYSEARLVCLAFGLDPALGVLHLDKPHKDGMVLDLIEAARPTIDETVFDLIGSRIFTKRDFAETMDGQCIVAPPLSHEFIERASEVSRGALRDMGTEVMRVLERESGMRFGNRKVK